MPRDHIHVLTAQRLREDFGPTVTGLICCRCHRELRVLDTIVEYPVGVRRYIIICEPCLNEEIRVTNWSPP